MVFHNPFFPFQPLFKLTKISLKFTFTPALTPLWMDPSFNDFFWGGGGRINKINKNKLISHFLSFFTLHLTHKQWYIYILLTKREGRTGRISARGLFFYAALGPYKKRPRADILPVRSRASLVNKRFIIRQKKALNVFHKQCPVQYLENIG